MPGGVIHPGITPEKTTPNHPITPDFKKRSLRHTPDDWGNNRYNNDNDSAIVKVLDFVAGLGHIILFGIFFCIVGICILAKVKQFF